MEFSDRTVLVTGAAVGIGRATAVKFAKEGAKVVALDMNANELENLKREVEAANGKILVFVCDVSDENAVNNVFAKATSAFGSIDILVNNAGIWRDRSYFLDTPTDMWTRYINVNIMGTVHCTKAALPSMIERGFGRIINVASVAGVYGNAKMVHYSATKGAIISMTKALAKEVADKGITVNAVSPGTVSPAEQADYLYTQDNSMNYMGRTGSTMENADLICFLASDDTKYISGQSIQIDGVRKKI
ncbi:MAG: SDR family oxidoreductase [Ruminococcaceae bacterium]|nr:SDR family oxidoreductase [Oscillospiraceae bacterium]